MRDRKEILKILCCEGVLILGWLGYFIKFNEYYRNTEILISDQKPLIDKLLIFVTYSKEKSFIFFGGGLCLVFLLIGMVAKSYSIADETDLKKQKSYLIWLLAAINTSLILALCHPMVYPIFIVFSLFSGTCLYIRATFNKLPTIEKDYEEDYQEDYEESYEGIDETKATK
ncbi:hypothetical protein [uncultured Vagococcus sp.]|uniref:hypothetical protein n=1 Tax=uncultured Vagococcus sp. TaxID=189676 RepID=UPI0028D88FFA|nr:hypothetical protein [uncultured Vagococcus sp.]